VLLSHFCFSNLFLQFPLPLLLSSNYHYSKVFFLSFKRNFSASCLLSSSMLIVKIVSLFVFYYSLSDAINCRNLFINDQDLDCSELFYSFFIFHNVFFERTFCLTCNFKELQICSGKGLKGKYRV
ncbi:hypothetical protein S245_072131, partial [Arachis hypogaea]